MAAGRYALAREFELCEPPSRKGSGVLYNLLPFEEDANRAAARLTDIHFGPATESELTSTDAPLFRDDAAIEPDTLALRVLAFSALFPEGMAWVANKNKEPLNTLLLHFGDDAQLGWDLLYAKTEIRDYGRAALSQCPSESVIDSSPTPAVAWSPSKERIQEGKATAEAVLGAQRPPLRLN